MNGEYEVFGQLILATLLGVLIGTERRLSHKTAGMRTFALVSLGAALFTIISSLFAEPSRIAAQIVTGIGFLGAGMIVFTKGNLRGLTTAAGLWVSAGIGMAVGYKLYAISIFTTFLAILIFLVLWWVEERFVGTLVHSPHGDIDDV